MSYIGSSAAVVPVAFSGVNSESFNGDGSTVAFTLNRPVSSVKAIEVVVNNVQQSPYDGSYSVNDTTLTFSAAPSSGTANIYVTYLDFPVGSITDPNAVAKTGDTMTGNLIVNANVGIGTSSHYDASTKLTVAGRINTSNGVAIGSMNYGGGAVVNIGSLSNHPVQLMTNNTTRVVVDTAGRVTMPYQPGFMAYVTNSSATFTAGTTILFDGTNFNTGSCYNGANGRFTAPVAGIYHFCRNQQSYSSSNQEVMFFKNGAQVNDTTSCFSVGANVNNSSIYLSLAAGDYVTVYQFSGTSSGDYSNFSGILVG